MQSQEHAVMEDVSYEILYQRYSPGIFAYLYKRMALREDAEDMLLEVFLVALERKDLLQRSEQEQQAWLWRVARNKVADHYRRMTRHPSVDLQKMEETLYTGDEEEPEQVTLKHEEHAYLHMLIAKLPALQQDVLRLRFGHGLRCTEIATVLEKKEGTIRMVLFRTLKFLRYIYSSK